MLNVSDLLNLAGIRLLQTYRRAGLQTCRVETVMILGASYIFVKICVNLQQLDECH
jgi:hypothetical protein